MIMMMIYFEDLFVGGYPLWDPDFQEWDGMNKLFSRGFLTVSTQGRRASE